LSGKRRQNPVLRQLAVWLLLAAGSAVMLFPLFSDACHMLRQSMQMESYSQEMEGQISREKDRWRAEAEAYNRAIARQQRVTLFSYRGAQASDPAYEAALGGPDRPMCVLEVPSAGICLPVMHGTAEAVLTVCAGHMYGSSLPLGGESTHSVLTGHTGLPTARLFTDLHKVQEGDEVFIRVLGECHCYTVSRIRVVLPEDEREYLQVEEGRDLLTLYTCTPYGINDHRLLVRCVRSLPDPPADETGEEGHARQAVRAAAAAAGLAAVPVLLLAAGLLRIRAAGKKK